MLLDGLLDFVIAPTSILLLLNALPYGRNATLESVARNVAFDVFVALGFAFDQLAARR